MFAGKTLAAGQITDSLANIYAAPALTTVYVRRLRCVNTSATPQTVAVYKRKGGTNRLMGRAPDLQQYEAIEFEFETLEAGDSFQAQATDDAVVDFTIDGTEETA